MTGGDAFARPELWPLLLLVPVAGLARWAIDRARQARLRRIVGPRTRQVSPDPRWRLLLRRRTLAAAALLLALVAALHPQWGEAGDELEERGVDVLVVLDVSRSMLADDVRPSRLARARAEIAALAGASRGDRFGLVVFAGEARLLVPLTPDRASFAEMVGLADTLSVERGGTDIGGALETALEALEGATGDHEVVLLLTDGEDHEGRGARVAETCRARNITVHALGLGSPRGAKIAVEGEGGETFLADRTGRQVITTMDPASLTRLASITGGDFVDVGSNPEPLVELYEDRVRPMARKSFEDRASETRANRFQWFLLPALLLWLMALGLPERRRR